MNIAHLTGIFPNDSETFILNQLKGQIDENHEVQVFANRQPEVTPGHDIIEEYSIVKKTKYLKSPTSYSEGIESLIATVPTLLLDIGLQEVLLEFRHGTSAPRHLKNIQFFREYSGEFDICHAHFGTVANSFRRGIQELRSPLVVSFYGHDVSKAPLSDESIYDELFEETAAVTCLSEDMRRDLVDLGCPHNKTRKVPLCIDVDKFQYNSPDPSSRGPVKILTVARLTEKKGLRYAIRAVGKLNTERDIEYLIAGDGPMRDELTKLISDVDSEDDITILGWKDQEEISRLMKESHLFLLPSVTASDGDKEGTPTALLEAQASGLPIISTYHAGIPEIVIDEESGFLVPERDVGALISKIERLLNEPERWGTMAKKGREYIEENHSISMVTDDVLDLYHEVSL